jgi:hypothetical protein
MHSDNIVLCQVNSVVFVITLYPNMIRGYICADNARTPVISAHAAFFKPLHQHADTSPMIHQMNQLAAVRPAPGSQRLVLGNDTKQAEAGQRCSPAGGDRSRPRPTTSARLEACSSSGPISAAGGGTTGPAGADGAEFLLEWAAVATSALGTDPLCQRESSTSSPLIAQRGPTGSAGSNSPATHRWSAGSPLTSSR